MKPLSSFLDTPAVQSLEARYGVGLRNLPAATRMAIVTALSNAAYDVLAIGISQELDVIFAKITTDTDTWVEHELYVLLSQLDAELTDPQQAISLIAGIAEGLAHASM